MGAAESTARYEDDGRFQSGEHYTVLGVTDIATGEDIKAAYRKLALLHHPDKNSGDVEGATQRFAAIQQAYQILSSDQDRAYYDGRKAFRVPTPVQEPEDVTSSIPGYLRAPVRPPPASPSGPAPRPGQTDSSWWTGADRRAPRPDFDFGGAKRELTELDVMRFGMLLSADMNFFSDSGSNSFYALYHTLFHRIAEDEPGEDGDAWPCFGRAQTPWRPPAAARRSSVKYHCAMAFYNSWTKFSTSKDFSSRVELATLEGLPKTKRKKVDQRNRRLLRQAADNYNDAVRKLVMLVRTVDPRYVCRNSPCTCPGCYMLNLSNNVRSR